MLCVSWTAHRKTYPYYGGFIRNSLSANIMKWILGSFGHVIRQKEIEEADYIRKGKKRGRLGERSPTRPDISNSK